MDKYLIDNIITNNLRKGSDFKKVYYSGKLHSARYDGHGYSESMYINRHAGDKIAYIWIYANGKEVQSYGFTYYDDGTCYEVANDHQGGIQRFQRFSEDLKNRFKKFDT